MGAHASDTTDTGGKEDLCHRRVAACGGAVGVGPIPPKTRPEVPNAGPAVEADAASTYATAGKVLFAAAGAFAGVLLALVALHLYNSGRRWRARDRRSLAISGEAPSPHGLYSAVFRALPAAVPSPRGLDPAVLRALPVVTAAAGAGDCAVCLALFERGEEARALPRCGHRFHVDCIDAWFRGNSTCPLCRAAVEAPDDAEAHHPEVRIDVAVAADDAAAKGGGAPAMSSGTDLDKTRRVFASTRSASF